MSIEAHFQENQRVLNQLLEQKEKIKKIVDTVIDTLKNGNKIMICGNGGSASQSQHFAAEIVGRYHKERKGYPAIALTTDTSIITSVSNDYSYEDVFSRQVEAIGRENDLLIGLSTSGTSKNVKKAFETAIMMGIKRISLLGREGTIAPLSDIFISLNGTTPRIQEAHLFLIHYICSVIDEKF